MPRTATINRQTRETDVSMTLDLDGRGSSTISTGVGFLDHMLELFAKHGLFDLEVRCNGDTHVDGHHTTEDIGICLGRAVHEAVGDKVGINRYGHFTLPMEETLVTVGVDLSGRAWYVPKYEFASQKIGEFDTELVDVFWQAVAANGLMNLHQLLHHGGNSHHVAEALFKGTARALRMAVTIDPRQEGVPSSKGTLTE